MFISLTKKNLIQRNTLRLRSRLPLTLISSSYLAKMRAQKLFYIWKIFLLFLWILSLSFTSSLFWILTIRKVHYLDFERAKRGHFLCKKESLTKFLMPFCIQDFLFCIPLLSILFLKDIAEMLRWSSTNWDTSKRDNLMRLDKLINLYILSYFSGLPMLILFWYWWKAFAELKVRVVRLPKTGNCISIFYIKVIFRIILVIRIYSFSFFYVIMRGNWRKHFAWLRANSFHWSQIYWTLSIFFANW